MRRARCWFRRPLCRLEFVEA
uniref:Uncharacterized protein LOC107630213 n=1 Tax=Rhizophora mucronata TaxID=61149 RepID=A0A2P2KNJ2_RHIMU